MSPREDLHLDDELIALRALGERPGTPEEASAEQARVEGAWKAIRLPMIAKLFRLR